MPSNWHALLPSLLSVIVYGIAIMTGSLGSFAFKESRIFVFLACWACYSGVSRGLERVLETGANAETPKDCEKWGCWAGNDAATAFSGALYRLKELVIGCSSGS